VPSLEELGFDCDHLRPTVWPGGETEALSRYVPVPYHKIGVKVFRISTCCNLASEFETMLQSCEDTVVYRKEGTIDVFLNTGDFGVNSMNKSGLAENEKMSITSKCCRLGEYR